jgi:hypothetical protein
MITDEAIPTVRQKYHTLSTIMNEKVLRLWAASEALALGWGGITAVAEATGLSQTTIRAGIAECRSPQAHPEALDPGHHVRSPGAGRKRLAQEDRTLLKDLETLVDPSTRGDPQSPLLWTCKGTRKLAEALVGQGHRVSHQTIARLLQALGYNLQVNRKTREGASHPDRDAQFQYIAKQVRSFQRRGQPVVSVDTKKKELVGDFKNPGREWQPKGTPEEVRCKDVGIEPHTARFAAETLRRWWLKMGRRVYPRATDLLVTADGGGSNGSRSRLWKLALQEVADEIGLRIAVRHFPPGTSKWNKIEHRMFCHITENWRGRPLVSRSVVVNLIGNTRTKAGLRINAELDTNSYPTGVKVTDEELATVRIKKAKFHGEWNYTISPR